LVGEPLLCRPLGARSAERPWRIVVDAPFYSGGDSLTVRSPTLIDQETNNAVESPAQPSPSLSTVPQPLFATFLSDNNIPDGQMFPPGAEFVKSWKMANPGASDWPESTELVFVAGDRMAPTGGVPRRVHVGAVKAGEEVEIVAGEMKAPEVPGRYVSYWRLSDGHDFHFGHSIWVDITVAEITRALSALSTTDTSLASSSIIMPQPAQERTAPLGEARERDDTIDSAHTLSATLPSTPPSETDSFDSSISLVDAPVSPLDDDDDDDEAIYEDSRSHVVISPVQRVQEVQYVLLYDSSSSEDE